MTTKAQFEREPRVYALELVEIEGYPALELLSAALKYMSHDDVRDMLDCNELSPRFRPDDTEEFLENLAYNNDMDGDTMRQVVRDRLEGKS